LVRIAAGAAFSEIGAPGLRLAPGPRSVALHPPPRPCVVL